MTARHAGIPIERTRILIFAVAGLFYGLGGVLAAAQFGQGHALISQGRLFTTITAVVVGGTALSGGVGSVAQFGHRRASSSWCSPTAWC